MHAMVNEGALLATSSVGHFKHRGTWSKHSAAHSDHQTMSKNLKSPRMGKTAIFKALAVAFVGAMAVTTTATHAAATEFNFTGASQTFTITTDGLYDIQAFGAQGGNSGVGYGGAEGYFGGKGAAVGSFFSLSAGDQIQIIVGGKGGNAGHYGGGGGGGSFVYNLTTSSLMIAAGGGGGANDVQNATGGNGLAVFNGGSGYGGFGGNAGSGGGFSSAGNFGFGYGGGSFSNPYGGVGMTANGGFGGGGGGERDGGGGGGFDGGNAGSPSGGGTSYADPSSSIHLQTSGLRSGNGLVTIELAPTLAVPEPESLSLFGLGLGVLMLRRRRAGVVGKPEAFGDAAAEGTGQR